MELAELAKQIGIQLGANAIVDITNKLNRLKKEKKGDTGGKTVSDQDKIAAIKSYVSKKPTMREVAGEKGGGYIKKYAKGSLVRKPRSY
jgi:hypothetical protein